MASSPISAESSHKKPFFKRLISNITGTTKKERIAKAEKEEQAKQAAVKEQLAASLSSMQNSIDEFTPGLESKSLADLQKKMHAPRPENKTPQELKYERWKHRQAEKEKKKAEEDRITKLYVDAKISGNKKDIEKYGRLFSNLADIPKNRSDLEKSAKEFRQDRFLFLEGVMGMSKEEAKAFYPGMNNC